MKKNFLFLVMAASILLCACISIQPLPTNTGNNTQKNTQTREVAWQEIGGFFNSQFISSLIGALVGAFAGAAAAHRSAQESKERERLDDQIRAINVVITAAAIVCNTLGSLKKQKISAIYKNFHDQRIEFERLISNASPPPDTVTFDFQRIEIPFIPTDVISKHSYETLSLSGVQLGLVTAILNAQEALNSSIKIRQNIIDRFRASSSETDLSKAFTYFGVRSGTVLDREYLSSIECINQYINDSIFYSSQLCEELMKHGNRIRNNYTETHKSKIMKVAHVDFSEAQKIGLIPDEAYYENWLSGFVDAPKEPEIPFYKKILARFIPFY